MRKSTDQYRYQFVHTEHLDYPIHVSDSLEKLKRIVKGYCQFPGKYLILDNVTGTRIQID